jgi:hypothetical protein
LPEELSVTSARAAVDFVNAFQRLAPTSSSPAKAAFRELFSQLFFAWIDGAEEVFDLPANRGGPPYGMVEVAWAPERVREKAGLARSIRLEECASAFVPSSPRDLRSTFEEFAGYAREWIGIVEKGAEQGAGLLLAVYG